MASIQTLARGKAPYENVVDAADLFNACLLSIVPDS
jgi:hypothetical protein